MALGGEEMRTALALVAAWRNDPDEAVTCLKCGAEGLRITDHSTRPYAEWYRLCCPACGLDEMIHIPLGPPVMGAMD